MSYKNSSVTILRTLHFSTFHDLQELGSKQFQVFVYLTNKFLILTHSLIYKNTLQQFWELFDFTHFDLQELIAPVRQARVAVRSLLAVGARRVLHPVHEQLFVLLQEQELPQHYVCLGVSFRLESLSQHLPHPSEVCDGLVGHRLSNEVAMFLAGGRHDLFN